MASLAAAGVDVRVCIGTRIGDEYNKVFGISPQNPNKPGPLHAKFLLAGNYFLVGSANWTVSSKAAQECDSFMRLNKAGRTQVHRWAGRALEKAEPWRRAPEEPVRAKEPEDIYAGLDPDIQIPGAPRPTQSSSSSSGRRP